MGLLLKNLGLESSKNSHFLEPPTSSQSGHLDGLLTDTQDHRDHTTALLEPTSALEESSPTPTIVHASPLELTFPEPMPRLCQVSGNSRLDHAPVFPSETTFGWPAIFSAASLRTTTLTSRSHPNSSQTGTFWLPYQLLHCHHERRI